MIPIHISLFFPLLTWTLCPDDQRIVKDRSILYAATTPAHMLLHFTTTMKSPHPAARLQVGNHSSVYGRDFNHKPPVHLPHSPKYLHPALPELGIE